MTDVLLTGATGFVGSHAAELLRERGHGLRCTVRASSDLRWLRGLEVELAEVDLADGAGLEGALDGADRVVHVAGVTRAAREAAFRAVNVEGTRRLAGAARRAGVRRFVFVSSLAARGPDGADGPASAYGRSKRRAEVALRSAAGGDGDGDGDGMDAVVLRPGGVYGPRDTDMLPLFRLARRGWFPVVPGSGRVQPVYVRDVARAVVRAVEAPDVGFGPWPLGEEGRYRWAELAPAMAEALGRPVRRLPVPAPVLLAAGAAAEWGARVVGRAPRFDRRSARDLARRSWTCDPAPAMEALGWRPRVALVEGLGRTARWYGDQGWL